MSNILTTDIQQTISDKRSVVGKVSVPVADIQTEPSNKPIKFAVPVGWMEHTPDNYKRNRQRDMDKHAYIGHLLSESMRHCRNEQQYVSLYSGALRVTLGGNYKNQYLEPLLEKGLIEEYTKPYTSTKDGEELHSRGTFSIRFGKSKQYKLTCSVDSPLVSYTVTDPKLIGKINKVRRDTLNKLIQNNATARQVFESLKKITIDTERALAYTKHQYQYQELFKIIPELKENPDRFRAFLREIFYASNREDRKSVMTRYNASPDLSEHAKHYAGIYAEYDTRMASVFLLNEIQKGNHDLIWMTEDKRSKRLFHPLTSTPKDIRKHFLKLDNEPLIEYDAGSCQWKLFIKLCNILWVSPAKGCSIPWVGMDLSDYLSFELKENLIEKKADNNMLHNLKTELARLNAYLDTGLLYDTVTDITISQGRQCDRAKAKKWLISNVLFGNPNEDGHLNFSSVRIFHDLFPHLFNVMKKLKQFYINEEALGYKPFDRFDRPLKWKAFPVLLQRMESEIFIKGIEHLNTPAITIHDAVLTNKSGEIQLLKALEKRIKESQTKIKLNRTDYAS